MAEYLHANVRSRAMVPDPACVSPAFLFFVDVDLAPSGVCEDQTVLNVILVYICEALRNNMRECVEGPAPPTC